MILAAPKGQKTKVRRWGGEEKKISDPMIFDLITECSQVGRLATNTIHLSPE
jgi:hypothetical protein